MCQPESVNTGIVSDKYIHWTYKINILRIVSRIMLDYERERKDIYTLSEWVKAGRSLIQI